MTCTCCICGFVSQDVPGREVWSRECGFFEIERPEGHGFSGGWSACSVKCLLELLSKLTAIEFIPTINRPSKTWKCFWCGSRLNKKLHSGKQKREGPPSDCVRITPPYTWSYELSFCCDGCAMKFLRAHTDADNSILAAKSDMSKDEQRHRIEV